MFPNRKRRFTIKPTLIKRPSIATLPPVEDIAQLAQSNEWLRFEIPTRVTIIAGGNRLDPTQADRERIVQELIPLLPEHRIWNQFHIDPCFFIAFLKSTLRTSDEFVPLFYLLRDWWENAEIALKFLEQHRFLRRISKAEIVARGWAFIDR